MQLAPQNKHIHKQNIQTMCTVTTKKKRLKAVKSESDCSFLYMQIIYAAESYGVLKNG